MAAFHFFLSSLLLGSLVAAGPMEHLFRRDNSAASIIGAIMPGSLSCANPPAPGQCATNVEAAPYLISAMTKYGIYSPAEIAAVLALIAVESGELKYRHSTFPVVAGKGTSNMQSPAFNAEYAQSIPELASGFTAANGDPDTILALVTPDDYNFGSGPWFLTKHCDGIRPQLQANTDDGFTAYMECVGTNATDIRLKYWHAAQTALGL